MKKLLIVLALSTLMLSGCGIFRSHKSWEKAKQEAPLEIPPSMDRPSTDAALVIPPKVEPQTQTASTQSATAQPADPTSMHLDDGVDTAWRRVGQALARGDLGTVSAQDQAGHSYELKVASKLAIQQQQSFMQKHFNNTPDQQSSQPEASDTGSNAGTSTVTIRVTAAADGGSIVNAQGDPTQAARVVNALKGRLGG